MRLLVALFATIYTVGLLSAQTDECGIHAIYIEYGDTVTCKLSYHGLVIFKFTARNGDIVVANIATDEKKAQLRTAASLVSSRRYYPIGNGLSSGDWSQIYFELNIKDATNEDLFMFNIVVWDQELLHKRLVGEPVLRNEIYEVNISLHNVADVAEG